MTSPKDFLAQKVTPIMDPLLFELLSKKPEDPVDFMIQYLAEYLKNPPQNSKPKSKKKEPGSEDENLTDEEEDTISEEQLAKKRVSKVTNVRKAISAEAYGEWNKKEDFVARVIPKSADQLKRIKEKLPLCFIFNALDAKDLQIVIDAMEEKIFKPGENVIKQGEEGNALYVVDSGVLNCYRQFAKDQEPKFLKEFTVGAVFGELALLYNAPRAATITAKTESICWSLDRPTFNAIVKEAAIKKRNKYEEFMKTVQIFQTIETYELMKILDGLKPVDYKAGEQIIKEGDEGNVFFLLESGEAYAMKTVEAGKPPVKVMDYTKGSYFGELALIRNTPRAASVFAKTDVTCLTLDRHSFKRLLGPLDDLLKRNTAAYEKFMSKQ